LGLLTPSLEIGERSAIRAGNAFEIASIDRYARLTGLRTSLRVRRCANSPAKYFNRGMQLSKGESAKSLSIAAVCSRDPISE